MSRYRLECLLRRNADYKALTLWLDQNGFEGKWEVVKRNEKGHPELRIASDGKEAFTTLSSTPGGHIRVKPRLARMKRALRAVGLLSG